VQNDKFDRLVRTLGRRKREKMREERGSHEGDGMEMPRKVLASRGGLLWLLYLSEYLVTTNGGNRL
jgi:hypothetical protein